MRQIHRSLIVFLTMQSTAPVGVSRYVLKLAHAMRETGFETAILNLGQGLPRPAWLIPPYRTVEQPDELHALLSRMPPHVTIGTNLQTAFLAHDEAMYSDGDAYYFMSGPEATESDDILQTHLFSLAVRLGNVLTGTPWMEESLDDFSECAPHLLSLAVDQGLGAESTESMGKRDALAYSLESGEPSPTAAEGCRIAARDSGSVLRVQPFGYAKPQNASPAYVTLPWHEEDSPDRSRLYGSAAAFVHPTGKPGPELHALDAMACGCPVVAVPSGSTDTICVDGENCIFADEDSPQSVAAAIGRLAADSAVRTRLVEGGRRTVERMTWQAVLDSLPEPIQRQRDDDRALGLGAVDWHRPPHQMSA
jgi:hypothetical protein